ncbi:MAG: DUF4390 domain-containing protein [Gammaproteobacteria bacterium]|nr:DUF4390 domain-containing protein [Gammaproteobacteria bacterium]
MLAVCAPASAIAAEVVIRQASTRLVDQTYLLDANIKFDLGEEALEALEHGIPLYIVIDCEVTRERDYLWDETVTEWRQVYRLDRHALTDQYLLINQNTGLRQHHSSLERATQALGKIHGNPLLQRSMIEKGYRYIGRMRARLDIEALPPPMRPTAYVSSTWRLSSPWYEWTITP